MVLRCVVTECKNNSTNFTKTGFFKIPPVIEGKDEKTNLLSELRQDSWFAALSHCKLNLKYLDSYRICSEHFASGSPSSLYDTCNIDWVPTFNLGHKLSDIQSASNDKKDNYRKPVVEKPVIEKFSDTKPLSELLAVNKAGEKIYKKKEVFIGEFVSCESAHGEENVVPAYPGDHTYSKRQTDVDPFGDLTKKDDHDHVDIDDTDSLSTLTAASPRFYFSSDSEDLVFDISTVLDTRECSADTLSKFYGSDLEATTEKSYNFKSILIENYLNSLQSSVKKEILFEKEKSVAEDTSYPESIYTEFCNSNFESFVKEEVLSDEDKLIPSNSSIYRNMEVIDLSDDDILEIPKKKSSGVKRPFRCLNSDCRTEKDLIHAEEFVRRHFGVIPYPKKRRVCRSCYNEAKRQQDSLVEALESKRLLLAEKLPPPKTTVCLTDSDSDPTDNECSSGGSEYELECDEDKTLEETIGAIFSEIGLEKQIKDGVLHLNERMESVEDGYNKLDDEYASIEKQLDQIRKEFYDSFRPEIMWLPALDIGPTSTVIYQADGTEVIAESSVYTPSENLPPVGPLSRHELQPNEMCYSMKYSLFARWVQAQVVEVEKRELKNTLYKIRYNKHAKGSGVPRVLPGRQLAFFDKCRTRIPVGTRIIAKYKDEDPKNATVSGSYYVGVVAEIPTAANKYRYLIFFDDGYAQYVHHNDIRVVVEASSCPWDDVSSDSREFIKEYLQMYPERPMVRLQKHNFVKTEWNGRWWRAQVMEVDGSLVRMYFPVDGRSEWIYRGSTRLAPLFNKKLNIQAQAEQSKTIRRRTTGLTGRTVVEYGTFGQGHDAEAAQQGERRAVARKSTMSRASTPPRDVEMRIEQESKGFTNEHALQEKIMKYRRHVCSSDCLGRGGDSMLKHKDVSPLLYPILQGWNRLMVKQRRKTASKNEIYYVAPCGLRLRSSEEVFQYLVDTESNLEIDCFSFELGINVSHEWEPFKRIYYADDITKGEENVKISCVNSLDDAAPVSLTYCNIRLPTEHVPLNLDPGFLVCCDCTDSCQDKEKCACRQLTIHGTRILDRKENPTAGYHHRRLYDQVQSGIYECNSRCNCAPSRCMNRVVQHPLRLKLQLFKTARRGWGVRTLCDIPRGGFICVYVGKILSEAIANEEGKQMIGGDDYYAELDYIEVMENAKEGFEEDAMIPEEESLSIFQKDTCKSPLLGSDLSDSDGFLSENEADNPAEDKDFSQPHYHKKETIGKRQKSARLQERSRSGTSQHSKTASRESSVAGSAAPSDDESSNKNGDKSKNGDEKVSDSKAASRDQSEDEDEDDEKQRRPQNFLPSQMLESQKSKERKSVREYYGKEESVYIMDAKHTGNIGRYLNHSCEPNVFVQNVFVDTHDLRFPWIAFFSICNIRAGTELTWDYSYEVDSVPGKIKYCYCSDCGTRKCRGRLL